jgi:hypothetical protein
MSVSENFTDVARKLFKVTKGEITPKRKKAKTPALRLL